MKKILILFFFVFALGISAVQANFDIPKLETPQAFCFAIDLGSLDALSDDELTARIESEFESNVPSAPELICTVTITGSVGVGENKIVIEVSVTGPCNEVRAEAVRIMRELKKMLTS